MGHIFKSRNILELQDSSPTKQSTEKGEGEGWVLAPGVAPRLMFLSPEMVLVASCRGTLYSCPGGKKEFQ